ncbi:MAG: ketol-acid reductoisomerase [Chloroflexi bacterium]|nr:ketol-acid reductoisomerase [Chloroflexota bacterium]MCI0845687.1 ketol-acid reductoisomerase [Chloroflexota bacterium]
MVNVYYDKDADLGLLADKTIGIVGYGSQGHAHALNLKDNGQNVVVGLYPGSKSRAVAEEAGLEVTDVPDLAKRADVLMILIPDHIQGGVYKEQILPNIRAGSALMVAHGFSIHYGEVVPPDNVDVMMVAPKAPGHRMRELFKEGVGVPSLLAVHQDATGHAKEIGLAYAKGIGSTGAGVLETTFKFETESDLFGEQTILCGGVTSLVQAAFDTLVEGGYPPEIAYFECMHELKMIVDLMYQGGFNYMRFSVSDTAEYGDLTRGPRVIDEHVRENMRAILKEIQDGSFAREWIAENDEGRKRFTPLREEARGSHIEEVGKQLRSMMPWLDPK